MCDRTAGDAHGQDDDPADNRSGRQGRDQNRAAHDTGDLQLFWSGNSNCMHHLITTDDIKIPIQQCAAAAGWAYQIG